jgi:hypothetical protein
MAIMIPPGFDETTTSNAEGFLYYHLQNHLEDDWTVIHSLAYLNQANHHIREGECDFLLFHHRHGMLVLEVKSGTPKYEGRTREWNFEDGSKVKDPFEQARNGMHYLKGLLVKKSQPWREARLPYGYAVAFPDAMGVKGNLRPDMGMDLLFLNPDMERIQDAVIKLLDRFRNPNHSTTATKAVIDSAVDVLQPTFSLVKSLAPTIERAHQKLIRLTEEQAFTLEGMAGNTRLVVRGGAGTGKTLLIITQARRLIAEGKRVLILCYNRPLGAYLRDQLMDETGLVYVGTFHEFCQEIVNATESPVPDSNADNFWDAVLPDTALAAVGKFKTRYDAILVDEAQDFHTDWWLLIEELLADPKESFFHLFGDEEQKIYTREGKFPFTKPEFLLRRNCRNTAPVAKYIQAAVGLKDDRILTPLPDGPDPVVHQVSGATEERDAVRRVLHDLIQVQGVNSTDIVILGCHTLERSSFGSACKLGNFTIREASTPESANTIRYSTVHKFKGLEADCVLLVGIDEPSGFYKAEHMRRFEYVGGSRARVVLHVFKWN